MNGWQPGKTARFVEKKEKKAIWSQFNLQLKKKIQVYCAYFL